jgi:hypothetical protein
MLMMSARIRRRRAATPSALGATAARSIRLPARFTKLAIELVAAKMEHYAPRTMSRRPSISPAPVKK